jgi:phosphatidylcholine synthase
MRTALAWGVHAYTATGVVLSYLMVAATMAGDYRAAFLWMLAATAIDATDGWLARAIRVSDVIPQFNGARLDDIVDYLTFVFAPAILIAHAELVRGPLGTAALMAVLASSAYGFGREDAKTADCFFTGFPSYWNIVAFYLYAARPPAHVSAAVLLGLAAMVFVPIGYVYPTRTPTLRSLTLTLAGAWGLVLIWMVRRLPDVDKRLLAVSLIYPAYYLALSLVLHSRRAARAA